MNNELLGKNSCRPGMQVEFDLLADEYRNLHLESLAITGESPEYFAEYKIADLNELLGRMDLPSMKIFDFGCGIGNSLPYFRKYFSKSELICADVSERSLEIAQKRFPGGERYVQIGKNIPLPTASQDVVYSACVFHHIPQDQQQHWLVELGRITKPGGVLTIYEHNPLNPLTLRAVKASRLDVNAQLIRGNIMRKRALTAGWGGARVDYKVFFPSILAELRPIEQYLEWLGLGAQYRMMARRLG